MEPPDELLILHQPTRLRIMAMLSRHRDCSFRRLRDALGLTDGNLGSHAKRLEEEGLLVSRRSLGATGVVVRFAMTARGDESLARYAGWLQRMADWEPPGSDNKKLGSEGDGTPPRSA